MTSDSEPRHKPTSNVSTTMPTLIKQVKENAFSILSNNFSQFFSSCDDLFFDLASKAGSNNEQNLYFDSMREVRIKKPQVWSLFKQKYEDNFRAMTRERIQPRAEAGNDQFSLESIGLVDKEDMEQDVAVTGIVNRARIENQDLLYQLNCRFDYLMPDVRINEGNNPLDPAQICAAVTESLKAMELDIKCKVILLKHLDRTVIVELRNIYSLVNELLVSAGVLPQIHFDVRKNKSPVSASSAGAAASAANAETGPALETQGAGGSPDPFAGLGGQPSSGAAGLATETPMGNSGVTLGQVLNIFDQLRDSGISLPNALSRPPRGSSQPISQQNLLDALTTMQLSSEYLQTPQRFDVRSVVGQILDENKKSGKEDALDQSDEDIINLVAMFFDFVLDDRNLPVPFQALISRLQIPILKVALKDKKFFSHSDHPARRLINEIAASAVGWDESSETTQDALYKEVNRLVHFIIENFTGDTAIFEQALAKFQNVTKLDRNKATVLEKRTQEAAQGKAKAEHARHEANEVLYNRLKDATMPESMLNFLVKDWQKVLLYVHLKQGVESTEWLEARQVVEQLVWAFRPHEDQRSLNRLEKIKDELINKISHGLELVNTPREQILNLLSVAQQTFEEVITQRLDPSSLISIQPAHLAALGQGQGEGPEDWDTMTAVQRQQLKLQAAAKEYIAKAEKVRPGTWMDYSPPNSSKTFRCKLAMITDPGHSYVFVNRYGLRVFEKKLQEFAHDLQRGYVKLLENGVLFDRAMGNITDKLKQLAG
ncbi:MAG: DUF1631 domain-containing protein [Pseudomonadota bacterium]|nr:hypothetical protein [Pseudomonadales bacterium]MDY6918977.1 DUF1631 domain-containing protein [Pseudomonadota bacterium]